MREGAAKSRSLCSMAKVELKENQFRKIFVGFLAEMPTKHEIPCANLLLLFISNSCLPVIEHLL